MSDLPTELTFDDECDEQDAGDQLPKGRVAAVVTGTDWTAETIVSQLARENIQLNPRFQRRDAWKKDRKSRFIESLIVGLPIPQIVLAESKTDRGKFIVLDGKQRLLAILQYWGLGSGTNNNYSLTGLTLRGDLGGKSYHDLSHDPDLSDDYNSLINQPIRTVVIRNWRDSNFLHTVFLRLNTGSVMLSPQELRQALQPGPFTTYVDDAAAQSKAIRHLLGIDAPDPRMRDIEILARFLAFRFFAEAYPGRMKAFLDNTFEEFNTGWNSYEGGVTEAVADFESGVLSLIDVFGDELARKPQSKQFNRAIFDALIYYHSQGPVRSALRNKKTQLKRAYGQLVSDREFLQAVEKDTAGAPHTSERLRLWAKRLEPIVGRRLTPPDIPLPGMAGSGTGGSRGPVVKKAAKKRRPTI